MGGGGGVGGQGREVVVSWSLATLEMKAPMEGSEAVSGGSVFQSLTVPGTAHFPTV